MRALCGLSPSSFFSPKGIRHAETWVGNLCVRDLIDFPVPIDTAKRADHTLPLARHLPLAALVLLGSACALCRWPQTAKHSQNQNLLHIWLRVENLLLPKLPGG